LADTNSAAFLAAEREALLVQQALLLLEQGDRDAAPGAGRGGVDRPNAAAGR
jgi:hypothetical protein